MTINTDNPYAIGDALQDGWVVGPKSPDTGIPMLIAPENFNIEGNVTSEAANKLLTEKTQNEPDIQLPTHTEFLAIYNQLVAKGLNQNAGFKTVNDKSGARYYTSSAPYVWGQVALDMASGVVQTCNDARIRFIKPAFGLQYKV